MLRSLALAGATLATASAAALPHIVMFLVDDWGHADVGYHRNPGFNETVTPNIDALVASGVQLDQHYVHKYCSPTRSSLQSGRLPASTRARAGPTRCSRHCDLFPSLTFLCAPPARRST